MWNRAGLSERRHLIPIFHVFSDLFSLHFRKWFVLWFAVFVMFSVSESGPHRFQSGALFKHQLISSFLLLSLRGLWWCIIRSVLSPEFIIDSEMTAELLVNYPLFVAKWPNSVCMIRTAKAQITAITKSNHSQIQFILHFGFGNIGNEWSFERWTATVQRECEWSRCNTHWGRFSWDTAVGFWDFPNEFLLRRWSIPQREWVWESCNIHWRRFRSDRTVGFWNFGN